MFKKIRSVLGKFTDKHTTLAGALSMISLIAASLCGFLFYGYLPSLADNRYAVPAVLFGGTLLIALFIMLSLALLYPRLEEKKDGGPYFKGQTPAHCGHYYPDVVLLGDKIARAERIRVLHCVFCGGYSIPLGLEVPSSWKLLEMKPLPTDEWREKTRQGLRKMF